MSLNSDRGAARLDNDHIAALRERMKYLGGRIKAKKDCGWETQWDERERNALEWALERLDTSLEWEILRITDIAEQQ